VDVRLSASFDERVPKAIERLQKKTGHSLGHLISDLLARSLA
jgi:hypothetical protein